MYSVINNGPSPKKKLGVLDKHCYCCLAAEEQLCSHIALCLNSKGEPCLPVLPFTPLCFVTIVLENNRPCQRAVRVPINSTVPATSVKIELLPQTPAYRLLSPCWGGQRWAAVSSAALLSSAPGGPNETPLGDGAPTHALPAGTEVCHPCV